MEVADQWRRQWAGTAEYGKVTEGGVTRRVARAMEVLHASGPGARVRVMRAAYHSSAGPGAPAETFMLHSSRRVISSGFNFIESPSLPTKPLEISSTPLEMTHDSNGEIGNYKVTEPDDIEISEPSKWRGSTRGGSIRTPSDESSSTDNASIIDLDSRNSRNLNRKYSYDSESSDIQFRSRSNSRTSQLLDDPTTLSTLKYKSLLNSSNEWNTRRKSYSFEDASPLNETILHNNDTLAMESSTDSGICKSTEIVNDHIDNNSHIKYFGINEKPDHKKESFKDWLSKNRQTSHYRGTKFKTYREHDIVIEEPKENNIVLQSTGKLSITLPITMEADPDDKPRRDQPSEESDRKIKKVEFCKTEVHFAAESGKVNIIATDKKPPPTTDFRKRRSVFVPMQDMVERPITLFGEKPDLSISNTIASSFNHNISDFGESDENTAATKSILKNKIPKPKPYLLGENMDFGISTEVTNKTISQSMLNAVSLVNESEKWHPGEIKPISNESDRNIVKNHILRTNKAGPTENGRLKRNKHVVTNVTIEKAKDDTSEYSKNKGTSLKESLTPVKPKTRQLRPSDLTYFGIDKAPKANSTKQNQTKFSSDNVLENIFHSVKLIQQVSNSVSNSCCNSEPESEDSPEYQNIPMNHNYAPVPTPRTRSIYDDKPNEIARVRAGLKPIIEKEDDGYSDSVQRSTRRRTKLRKQEEIKASRSHSEPPKNFNSNSRERPSRRGRQDPSFSKHKLHKDNAIDADQFSIDNSKVLKDIPIYVNLNVETIKSNPSSTENRNRTSALLRQKEKQATNLIKNKIDKEAHESIPYDIKEHPSDSGTDANFLKKHSIHKDTVSNSLKREAKAIRGEKNHKLQNNDKKNIAELSNIKYANSYESKHKNEQNAKTERHNRSIQKTIPQTSLEKTRTVKSEHSVLHQDTSSRRKRHTSEDKISAMRENLKPSLKVDSSRTRSNEREKESESKHLHRSKHRGYVINYDDKNGTVSSICKIKSGQGSERRKKTSKEILKENHKVQLEDHQGDPNRLIYGDRKWKTKVHTQRSCEVL